MTIPLLSSVDPKQALFGKLAAKIPSNLIRVAESGIRSLEDGKKVVDLGYYAVLVGEALVRLENPANLISALRGLSREH